MLKSCKYCGRVHDDTFKCSYTPIRKKQHGNVTRVDRFHHSHEWTDKAREIKERDHYMCQLCLREFKGTFVRINTNYLSVHHVDPLVEDWSKRLDDDNLITTCRVHHEMMERGEISRDEVRAVIADLSKIPPT